jgi:hypothetical protein
MSIQIDANRSVDAHAVSPNDAPPEQSRPEDPPKRGAPKQDGSPLSFLAQLSAALGRLQGSAGEQVDQTKVETALRACRSDPVSNQSELGKAMRNPNLNGAERNQIIQTLAREDGQQLRFYANDASRTSDEDRDALNADQRAIADAVQKAYKDGAINADDLLRIADVNDAGDGAERFMSILQTSDSARARGGAVDGLADALWARNGGNGADRAEATMYYMSDPALEASKLNTPDKRAAAFEALLTFNESDPYEGMSDAPVHEAKALATTGRLFLEHSQELIDHYTRLTPDKAPETEWLAKFMSQTVFNPEADGIALDRSRDLVPTVRAALGDAGNTYLDRARQAKPDSLEQRHAMEQFGRLSASVSGGAAVALTRYSDQIEANDESRKQFADLIGSTVGHFIPVDTPVGNPVEMAATAIAEKAFTALKDPERPDARMAAMLDDQHSQQVEALRIELDQPGLLAPFDGAYSHELLDLQANLNVNLGAHAS